MNNLVVLIISVIVIVSNWKLYEKSGHKGWKAIIPIYNLYVLFHEINKRPAWWIILLLVPIVNIAVLIIVYMDWALKFGKSKAFGVGMALLPFVFLPMLAFSDATYNDGIKNDILDSLGEIGKQDQ
ncbi:DUF5684 domain-containing protein [Apibacter muscae]|uniref:DUF5684 domain-containing protein n=1 Tax=Apibacter muscae TaxID=2509004 RepID=UPI001628F8D3|nr:DUF5684 domain-containing protein [Apibacter muscae]